MLYLGIDQHARQLTISLRDDSGDVLQARQVSTQPEKVNAFFQQLTRERLRGGKSFVAVLEVCGFNDWLIRMLQDYRCYRVILEGLKPGRPARDSDGDGLSDGWEAAHQLDAKDPTDGAKKMPSGYTAIEEYCNELAER